LADAIRPALADSIRLERRNSWEALAIAAIGLGLGAGGDRAAASVAIAVVVARAHAARQVRAVAVRDLTLTADSTQDRVDRYGRRLAGALALAAALVLRVLELAPRAASYSPATTAP